jgi:hypothetical protein
LESIAETQPQLQPAFLRCQRLFRRSFLRSMGMPISATQKPTEGEPFSVESSHCW